MTRPLIGVTVSARTGWRVFPLIKFNLWLVGSRAVRWTFRSDVDLDSVDGVVIGGGDDIGPELYGMEPKLMARLDPDRDRMEHGVATSAMELGMPLMGICRGAQMLNIALGGTLHQDVWSLYPEARMMKTILPKRTVQITSGTKLAEIAGLDDMRVNALHTQAVDTLGEDLVFSARDTHGMVQAIERCSDPFAIGVQWHPEHLFYAKRQRALFASLTKAASAYKAGRQQIAAA